MVGASRGTVYVCDHERQELWSRVTAGSERVEIRLPFGKGLAGFAAQSGEPLCANDVQKDPHFDPGVDLRTGFHTENALCNPIRDWQGTVVAVLQLLNKPGGFTDADMEFLDLMGVSVAQALANAARAALDSGPDSELEARALVLLASARLARGVAAEAEALVRRAIALAPDHPEAALILDASLYAQGELDRLRLEAIAQRDRLTEDAPLFPMAQYWGSHEG